MTKQTIRVGAAFVVAGWFLVGRPVFAQVVQSVGWPEKGDSKQAAALPSKPAAAPAPVRAKVAAPKARVETAAAPRAARAGAVVASVPPPKLVVADAVGADLVQALQQQAEILNRLATEIESQRVLMREQQEKISALELRAAAANATPATTVETGGIKLRVSDVVQGWHTVSRSLVPDTLRLRRTELNFSGDISPRVTWTLMVDPAKTLSLSNPSAALGGTSVFTGTAIGQSGRMLQDAFVSLHWQPSVAVEVGHAVLQRRIRPRHAQ